MKTKFRKHFNNDVVIEIDQKDNTETIKNKGLFYFRVKEDKHLSKLIYMETEHLNSKIFNIDIKVMENNIDKHSDKCCHYKTQLYEILLDKYDEDSVFNRIILPITFIYKGDRMVNDFEKRQNILLSIEYNKLTKKLVCKIIKEYKVKTIDDDCEYIENRFLNKCKEAANDYFRNYGIFNTVLDFGKAFFKVKKKK